MAPCNKMAVDEPKVKRPRNCFQIWLHEEKQKFLAENPTMDYNTMIKILGARWTQMPDEVKLPYENMGEILKRQHRMIHPNYKYQPRKNTAKNKSRSGVIPVASTLSQGTIRATVNNSKKPSKRPLDVNDDILQSKEDQSKKRARIAYEQAMSINGSMVTTYYRHTPQVAQVSIPLVVSAHMQQSGLIPCPLVQPTSMPPVNVNNQQPNGLPLTPPSSSPFAAEDRKIDRTVAKLHAENHLYNAEKYDCILDCILDDILERFC